MAHWKFFWSCWNNFRDLRVRAFTENFLKKGICLFQLSFSASRDPNSNEDYSSANAAINFWTNLTADQIHKLDYEQIHKDGVGKCPHQKHYSEEKCLRILLDGSNSIKNFDHGRYWAANLSAVALASGLWNIQVIQFSDEAQHEAQITNDNDAARNDIIFIWSFIWNLLKMLWKSAIKFIKTDIPAIAQIGGGSNFAAMKDYLVWFSFKYLNNLTSYHLINHIKKINRNMKNFNADMRLLLFYRMEMLNMYGLYHSLYDS